MMGRNIPLKKPNQGIHRVREAVLHYPMTEELDFRGCCLRSIPCLRNLRNLVCLNITCGDNISGVEFNDGVQEIGPQLKRQTLNTYNPMDIRILLQNCPNLKSLRIEAEEFTEIANLAVSLLNLQRLTFQFVLESVRRVFRPLPTATNLLNCFYFMLNASMMKPCVIF
ncbi:hypothetical protein AVEN_249974-1 [Araneus ventricosus]|uniref:Uncharacterized protein n=1 Tax=Araneus ventricosus TaxID=182803 RepID=A0A4Y2HF31_ARAVE|nr:hypothetical protein AVEN_249974-1 [Araneus ventricosus]